MSEMNCSMCNGLGKVDKSHYNHNIKRYVFDTPKGVEDPLGFTYQALDIYYCVECGKIFVGDQSVGEHIGKLFKGVGKYE